MNMVLKAGSTSVLLRDALRRPLAELELGGVKAGLRSLPTGVTQVCPKAPPWDAATVLAKDPCNGWQMLNRTLTVDDMLQPFSVNCMMAVV